MWQRIIVLSIVSMACLFAQEKPEMINAYIKGNKIIKTSALESALEIKRPNMLFFWRDKTPKINTKLIPTIPTSLHSFFRSEGFYESTFTLKQTDDKLTINIQENRPVKITTIEIESDYPIKELIQMKNQDIFRAANFTQTKTEIISTLLKEGYCSYDLDTKAYVDLEAYSVDLVYKLKKGDKCTFGETNIKGLKTIDPKVVHSRLQARKGSRFGTRQVREMYERLNQLDAFENIVIGVDRKFFNEIPIDIQLKEITTPYYFSGGIGYDTYVGPRVQAQLTKRNFLGNAQKLILTTSYSPKEQVADIEFFKPALLNWRHYFVDFGLKGGYSNLDFKEFLEEKLYVRGFLSYLYRRIDLRAGLGLEILTITPQTGHTIPPQRLGDFTLFFPYFQAIYDARDSKLNPRYGYYLAGYLEYGVPYNTEASDYVKMLFEARGIYSFKEWTFSSVGKIGVIEEISGSLPESKLFFGGGAFSNRAYGYNTLGVINSPTTYTKNGGLSWANLSLEVNFPLGGNWRGALFNDNTMITPKTYDFNGEIVHAVGFGVRYMTPIGPLKLDLGVNARDMSQQAIGFQIGQSF